MPMPESLPGHFHASTDRAKLLDSLQMKQVNEEYYLHAPYATWLRSMGCKVETTDAYKVERQIEVGPAMSAGARGLGNNLPSQRPTINSNEERIAESIVNLELFLSDFYAGMDYDGPVAEAAKHGRGFARTVTKMRRNASAVLGWLEDLHALGDGTGVFAEVSSISTTTITLKRPTGTVALAGQMGLFYFLQAEYDGIPINFIDPSDGSVATVGGNKGWLVTGVDEANGTITVNRTAAGASPTIASGFLIAEGDDFASTYNNGFLGLYGWVDDGTVREDIFGHSRSDYRALRSFRIDAQSGGALGEWNWVRDARIARRVAFNSNNRVPCVLMDPGAFDEPIFGTHIDNAATRTQPGLYTDRRFTAMEKFNQGGTGVTMQVPGFGTVVYKGLFGVRPQHKFFLDPRDMTIIENGPIRHLEGFSGPGGHYIRHSDKHQFKAALWRKCTHFHRAPFRAGVEANVLAATNDTF